MSGGAVEHMNEEAGATWLQRLTGIYEHCVWLNPIAGGPLGLDAVDRHGAQPSRRPDVSADAPGP